MSHAERETLGVVFCLRSRTTGQSRPIIEFREVGRRYSVKLKPGFSSLPSPSPRDGLNIGNEALESSVDSSEANLSELTNKDGPASSRYPRIANSRRRSACGTFFNVLFSSLASQRLFFV